MLFDGRMAPPVLFTAAHLLIVGSMMASRIPTFAGKHIRIKHEWVLPFMIVATMLLVIFIIQPWLFLCLISLAYLVSICASVRQYRKLRRASDLAQRGDIQMQAPQEQAFVEEYQLSPEGEFQEYYPETPPADLR
jgi:hypothetical protein